MFSCRHFWFSAVCFLGVFASVFLRDYSAHSKRNFLFSRGHVILEIQLQYSVRVGFANDPNEKANEH